MTLEGKKCSTCKKIKSLSEFYAYVRKSTGKLEVACSCKLCKNKYSIEHARRNRDHRNKVRQAWRYRTGRQTPAKDNPMCSDWLGNITESILVEAFGAVQRMPPKNPGYDFICKNGYKIDAKASCLYNQRKTWQFDIHENKTADYFICIGFDNRESMTPTKVWLIKGELINDKKCIAMGQHSKYDIYLYDIDKIGKICDIKKMEANLN